MKCCGSKGLLKRFIPFFLTFAAGLLIASFFIPVTGPDFSGFGRKRWEHKQEDIRRQERIMQLEDKVAQQEEVIRNLRDRSVDWHGENMDYGTDYAVPPPMPPLAPAAAAAPPHPPAPAKAPVAVRR